MAKINLKVLTDIKQSEQQLKSLATSVESISKSFSSVKVDKNLTAQINALTKHYNAVAKAAEKVAKVNYNNQIQEEKLAQAKAKTGKAIAAEAAEIEKSKTQFAKHQKAVNDDTRAQEKHEAQMKKSAEQVKKSAKETKKHSQSIVSMIPNIIKWQVAMTAVMLPLRELQEGLDSINETLVETEKRVIALQRVAGSAANANELYDLAQKYGQSFENVADVTERFAKSGYDWADSLKAAEAALTAMNVAELDAEQSSEGLIAIIKQFKLDISDLNSIIGILNKTADDYAVDTEELLIALQKTGSTAKNAGLDLKETVGLITALSEGTAASGQNIGNALRSLFVFTSDKKALETFASLSDSMNETVKLYQAGGANILDVWKGLGEELSNLEGSKGLLSEVFGGVDLDSDLAAKLTQIEDQFAEIYGTAGNYRQNYFIALLDNIETATKAVENMTDVESYSHEENLLYMDTYEAKVTALQAKWQSLANDEQGFLAFKKGLVDAGDSVLTLIENVGGLGNVIASLSVSAASLLFFFKPGIFEGIVKGIKSIIKIIPNAVAGWNLYRAGAVGATAALKAMVPVLGLVAGGIILIAGHANKVRDISDGLQENVAALSSYDEELSKQKKAYDELISSVTKYKEILEDQSSLENEKIKAEAELLKIQNNLVKANNDYADSLDLVNGKLKDQNKLINKDYLNGIRQSVRNYLDFNADTLDDAKDYLSEQFSSIYFSGESDDFWGSAFTGTEFEKWLKNNGFAGDVGYSAVDKEGNLLQGLWNGIAGFFGADSYNLRLNTDAKTREDQISFLNDLFDKVDQDSSLTPEVRGDFKAIIQRTIKSISDSNYTNAKSIVDGNVESKSFLEWLSLDDREKIASGQISDDELQKLLNEFYELEDESGNTAGNVEKIVTDFSELDKDVLPDIVKKLKEARQATKDAYEYEEKKKAVLEAEKALEDAKNQRNVRVFNETIGGWVWESNDVDIQKAQDDLDSAKRAVEESAWNEVEDAVEAGNATNDKIYGILEKWSSLLGSDSKSFMDRLTSAILDASGIDVKPVYDSGGVLQGMGGIKATNEDEVVLGPSLTQKILSPVSNGNFDLFVKDLGLLFGASKSYASSPASVAYNNSSQSNESNYYINGVPISSNDASSYSIMDLIQRMKCLI